MTSEIRAAAGRRTDPDAPVPGAAARRDSRHREHAPDPPAPRGRHDTASADPARHGFVDQVRQLLDSLDQPDREALRLIYFRGLTQDDAARTLGVPRTVLRSCVARGMRELSRRLLAAAP